MILDTTFLIDLLKSDKSAVAKAYELDNASDVVMTTAITVFELWQGVHDAPEKEKQHVLALLESFGLESLDMTSAKDAGTIFDTLRRKGKEIDPEDCMIAGIARIRGEPLLTRNVKHFERIDGLKVTTY
jgi:tRNA(fMet)-specific endonuclease VapC